MEFYNNLTIVIYLVLNLSAFDSLLFYLIYSYTFDAFNLLSRKAKKQEMKNIKNGYPTNPINFTLEKQYKFNFHHVVLIDNVKLPLSYSFMVMVSSDKKTVEKIVSMNIQEPFVKIFSQLALAFWEKSHDDWRLFY